MHRDKVSIIAIDSLDAEPDGFMTTKRKPAYDSIHELKFMTELQEYQWCYDRYIQPADILQVTGIDDKGSLVFDDLLRFKRGLRNFYLSKR